MKRDDDIIRLNKQHELVMEKLDDFGAKLEDVRISLAELPDKIFERADKRYASKTAERIIYGFVGAICLAVIGGIMALVLR